MWCPTCRGPATRSSFGMAFDIPESEVDARPPHTVHFRDSEKKNWYELMRI